MNPIRGSTDTCLRHYAGTLQSGSRSVYQPLATFTGAAEKTAYRWASGKTPAKGVFLVRLRYFLVGLGYDVDELSALPKEIFDLGKLLAYQVLTLEELTKALDYAHEKQVLQVFHGKQYLYPRRLEKVRTLITQHRAAIERATLPATNVPQAAKRVSIPSVISVREVPGSAVFPASVPGLNGNLDHATILHTLAHAINVIRPLAKLVLSNAFTPEERRELHRLTGDDGVFHASNDLSRLCSERARQHPALQPTHANKE